MSIRPVRLICVYPSFANCYLKSLFINLTYRLLTLRNIFEYFSLEQFQAFNIGTEFQEVPEEEPTQSTGKQNHKIHF